MNWLTRTGSIADSRGRSFPVACCRPGSVAPATSDVWRVQGSSSYQRNQPLNFPTTLFRHCMRWIVRISECHSHGCRKGDQSTCTDVTACRQIPRFLVLRRRAWLMLGEASLGSSCIKSKSNSNFLAWLIVGDLWDRDDVRNANRFAADNARNSFGDRQICGEWGRIEVIARAFGNSNKMRPTINCHEPLCLTLPETGLEPARP